MAIDEHLWFKKEYNALINAAQVKALRMNYKKYSVEVDIKSL